MRPQQNGVLTHGRFAPLARPWTSRQGRSRSKAILDRRPERDRSGRRPRKRSTASTPPHDGAAACRRKSLASFPDGFTDETYIAWELGYKWRAHVAWQEALGPARFAKLLREGRFAEVAQQAVRIESRTNLLFSFEKMALRDAVRSTTGARALSEGLHAFLHGQGSPKGRFLSWRDTLAGLPRRKARVLTWPLLAVFGFVAQPRRHIFLKPNVTKAAAKACGYPFHYASTPNWETYQDLHAFAAVVRRDVADLEPRDMIDLQSFIWVQGSAEY